MKRTVVSVSIPASFNAETLLQNYLDSGKYRDQVRYYRNTPDRLTVFSSNKNKTFLGDIVFTDSSTYKLILSTKHHKCENIHELDAIVQKYSEMLRVADDVICSLGITT